MTKKDYELIAKCIQFRKQDFSNSVHARAALELLQESLAANFEVLNPRFDRAKFNKACETRALRPL